MCIIQIFSRYLQFFFLHKHFQIGIWGVGLALNDVDLCKTPGGHDLYSWVLCNDGAQRHNQKVLKAIDNSIEEGDIIVLIYIYLCNKINY